MEPEDPPEITQPAESHETGASHPVKLYSHATDVEVQITWQETVSGTEQPQIDTAINACVGGSDCTMTPTTVNSVETPTTALLV